METPHLFHLAAIASGSPSQSPPPDKDPKLEEVAFQAGRGKIRAAAAHMTFADRVGGEFVSTSWSLSLTKMSNQTLLGSVSGRHLLTYAVRSSFHSPRSHLKASRD